MARQGGGALPQDWQDGLVTKNTFLDWPSPWVDADHRRSFQEREESRPSSDPTSTSSRSSSVNSLSSSSGGKGALQMQNVVTLESLVGRVRAAEREERARAGPCAAPRESALWTPGAEGHEDCKCTPCINFSNQSCNRGASCTRCHFPHEKQKKEKKKRLRPPPRLRLNHHAQLAAEGTCREDPGAKFQELLQDMLTRAGEDGENFDIGTAEYVPQFVRDNSSLRERFVKILAVSKQQIPPPPPPSVPGAAASSRDGNASGPPPSGRALRPKGADEEDGNSSCSSNDVFSL